MRDALPELKKLGVLALGISPDAPAEQKRFDEKYKLGFPLLSDPDHRVASAYDVWGQKEMFGKTLEGIIRSAFLIDPKGRIAQAWYKISPEATMPALLKALAA